MGVIDVEADAERIWQATQAGGVAIIPLDVAYANIAQTPQGLDRIYRAKGRSPSKPSGMFGSYEIMCKVHQTSEREREVVSAVIHDFNLPLSIVAPFRHDHPMFSNIASECIERSTKAGTLDMLMNAGPLHNALARRSLERLFPVFGSSANRSLSGSKFRLADIEAAVREVAAIEIDYGLCRYANEDGVSSTIIALPDFEVLRFGCCYLQIKDILQSYFAISLPDKPTGEVVVGAARGEEADPQ